MSDLSNYSLSELVAGIKKKDFSSEEITKSFIANSEMAKKLNVYITKHFDKTCAWTSKPIITSHFPFSPFMK